jgi:hypothetical protein
MRQRLPLSIVFCCLFAAPVWAECAYPDSDRGDAPAWMCNLDVYEGADFLAYGDKSRLPSISLQSRLAAKVAMVAVVSKLLDYAKAELAAELPPETLLVSPAADDWSRVAKFKGVTVLEKTTSPRRHLYVLAGVEPDVRDELITVARKEVLSENKKTLIEQLGKEAWQKLVATK